MVVTRHVAEPPRQWGASLGSAAGLALQLLLETLQPSVSATLVGAPLLRLIAQGHNEAHTPARQTLRITLRHESAPSAPTPGRIPPGDGRRGSGDGRGPTKGRGIERGSTRRST